MRIATIALAALLLAGCFKAESGRDFDVSAAEKFKTGFTQMDEVVEILGRPWETIRNSDGSTNLVYKSEQTSGAVYFGTTSKWKGITLRFDEDRVLRDMYSTGTN